MKHRRVKITGIGPITPAGIGREGFRRQIFEPLSRITAAALMGKDAPLVAAGVVGDFRIGAFAVDAAYLDSPRQVQFAVASAALALRDAGLSLADVRKRNPLLVVARPAVERKSLQEKAGTTGSSSKTEEAVRRFLGAQPDQQPHPDFISSLDAIGFAAACVAEGSADLAICGGAEAPLTESLLAELKGCGLSSGNVRDPERQCRPFDLWRASGVVGEGACFFVLEPESSPRHAYGHVTGAGTAMERDGSPWSGLDEALRLALGNAGLRPMQIECIHAEGLGNKILDAAEAGALRAALGAHLDSIPLVSIKGSVGNALGAAGAIQVGCAVLGMKYSTVAPTVNWRHPDPACPLNLSAAARGLALGSTLVTGRDMSGLISCLVLTP